MPLYEVTATGLEKQNVATFQLLGMQERAHIQALLRDDISGIGDDLLVLAEEFGEWHDARRRIDLLAIDRTARLVVIELKRTEDGGHMELQAIRYAAMVSSMGFDEVLRTFTAHRAKHPASDGADPRTELLSFLGADDDEDPVVSSDVRIVLVSADFGREITTAVLWLNGFDGMDIRCVRLIPYDVDGKVLVDIQQVLPLPEAADYQVKLRRKDAARERARSDGRDFTRYHVIVEGHELPHENKRNAVRVMVQQLAERGVALEKIRAALPEKVMRVLPKIVTDLEEVRSELLSVDPKADLRRWYCEYPLVDDDAAQTYVLFKMWGLNTEPTLQMLSEAFPEAKVSYRSAEVTE